MDKLQWGIIGCGDVTEVKSGPAFNIIDNSSLVAVMRRDGAKAEDYAKRHNVNRWYTDANELINDPEVNAVYVATPPDSHAQYAIQSMQAGKPVYVEKPMARNYSECLDMISCSEQTNVPLFVAYYRRALPGFQKVKELVDSGAIGSTRVVSIRFYKPPKEADYNRDNLPWRVIPEISGGGYFFDLACHQLDFLDYLFGPIVNVRANAGNQGGLYSSEDVITAAFEFQTGVFGTGIWSFTTANTIDTDIIEIIGSKGKITMSTFDFTPIVLETGPGTESFSYEKPMHVQQYLIQTIVDTLLGKGTCPSTGHTASRTSKVMDEMVKEYYMNRSKRS